MYQIFQGLAYLHLNNLVHRDLKPDNILLNEKNEIKITDFGWSRKIESKKDPTTKWIANILYRAPEVCLEVDSHDWRVDIWAMGCIFYEILEKQLFVDADSNEGCLREIIAKIGTPTPEELNFTTDIRAYNWVYNQDPFPKQAPSTRLKSELCPAGRDLLDNCLCFDPRRRISALQALQHPYFKEIHNHSDFLKTMIFHAREDLFDFERNAKLDQKWFLNQIIEEIRDFNPPVETSFFQKVLDIFN